jgi:hypothetical protein
MPHRERLRPGDIAGLPEPEPCSFPDDLKCLEQDRRRPCVGAQDLADDQQPYLGGEPIEV